MKPNLRALLATTAMLTTVALMPAFAPAFAASPAFDEAVKTYHSVIGRDDADATEGAARRFGELATREPQEYRALVYQGSLTARQAKLAWMPWTKLKLANTGIDLMDKGVEAMAGASVDARALIEARMVRGITSARMPKMFKRQAVATADFRFIREHASFRQIGAVNQATVLAYSAVLAHRAEATAEAAALLNQARAVDDATATRIWAER